MDQVRVNLTLEKEVWKAFDTLVPQRKKSKMINELLKKEIEKKKRRWPRLLRKQHRTENALRYQMNGTSLTEKSGTK
jgi:metal-responsive CopG/Arc/MetJ family transcriptional regulator